MVTYICIKFQENISNSFQDTDRTHITEITIFNIQRAITLKVFQAEVVVVKPKVVVFLTNFLGYVIRT